MRTILERLVSSLTPSHIHAVSDSKVYGLFAAIISTIGSLGAFLLDIPGLLRFTV